MPIRLLPPEVSARIAAGEVVERPASVVKELLENALDAGATRVEVDIEEGGLRLIRVVDNGEGVPQADTPLLFRRHATSKLRSPEDLEAVATLGFRGEALYAIGSVAKVRFVTRHRSEAEGTCLEVEEGQVRRRERCGTPPGTSVTVQGLFRNVPARRKFLRSPATEAGRVQAVVAAYALAFPEVVFLLRVDGRPVLTAPGRGDLREAASAVYGAELARALLPVEGEEGKVRVWGLVGPPEVSRASRSYITLLVNRRPVQSRTLAYALEQAYQGFLPQGRHPLAVLHLQMPPDLVDVNVHPAKAEVRLLREDWAFTAVQRAVRSALLAQAPVPPLASPFPPTPGPGPLHPTHLPSQHPAAGPSSPPGRPPLRGLLASLRAVGQVHGTYIVAEGPDGLYLVDQHAAHERILFEEVLERARRRTRQAQGLLAPAVVHLSPSHQARLEEVLTILERFGWDLEPFGERAWLVRAVPRVLGERDPARALVDLLDRLEEEPGPQGDEERIASVLACHGAVRAGDPLTPEEMQALLTALEGTRQPHTCPHGRPTLVHLSAERLEREFRRR